jgi:hypothetical protein
MQFLCLEGPVVENYKNKLKTVENSKYTIQAMMQVVVDDYLPPIVIKASAGK